MTDDDRQRLIEEELFRKKVLNAIAETENSYKGLGARIWSIANSEIVKGALLSVVAILLTYWIQHNEADRLASKQKEERAVQAQAEAAEKQRLQASLRIEKEVKYVTSIMEYIDQPGPKLTLIVGMASRLVAAEEMSPEIEVLLKGVVAQYVEDPTKGGKAAAQQAVRAIDSATRQQTQAVLLTSTEAVALPQVPQTQAPSPDALCKGRRAGSSPARVYIQYSTHGAVQASLVRVALDKACFLAPGIEDVTGKATSPKTTEVRMFSKDGDTLNEAAQIKALIEEAVPSLEGKVQLTYVNPTWAKAPLPRRLYEVWFGTEE
ncbi:MAG: hypothetical protein Q8L22_10975 [Reyranella sp.]|nr:hypothetical protein [Reyranella sp.]